MSVASLATRATVFDDATATRTASPSRAACAASPCATARSLGNMRRRSPTSRKMRPGSLSTCGANA
jgi:hypothetical protein